MMQKFENNIEPLFTVVTIVFNGEKTISRTIESVLYQTYKKIEYIIIDGGSTDGTMDLIKQYEGKFLEKGYIFKYISERDKGISDAFNKGVALATGDLVGIINSDDWYESNALEIVAKNFGFNYAIYCGDLNLWEKEKQIAIRKSKPHLLWLGMYVMHPTVFVKKEIYEKFKFDLNHKIAMDFDFLSRVLQNKENKIKYIPKILSNMQVGGVSADINKMRIEEMQVIRKNSSLVKFNFIKFLKKLEELYFSKRK